MLELRLAERLAHALLDVAAAELAIGAIWWNSFLQPHVPECPEQRSTVFTVVPGTSCSVSRVFWPTFCTREWQGMWYETLPSGVLKSVLRRPSFWRAMRYSNGSNIAACTAFTSASPGNINGSSCLNIRVQEGIGVRIA
jgi:hypothetical protein